MKNKFKHSYFKNIIKRKKIKDGFVKSGIYGSIFNLPKKVERALKKSKNENHYNYLKSLFLSTSNKFSSRETISFLKKINN